MIMTKSPTKNHFLKSRSSNNQIRDQKFVHWWLVLISANQWEAFKEWSSPPPWTKVIIGLISNISFIRTIIAISKTEQLTFSLQSRTRNSTPCHVGRKVGNHRYCNPMGRVAGKKIRRGGAQNPLNCIHPWNDQQWNKPMNLLWTETQNSNIGIWTHFDTG